MYVRISMCFYMNYNRVNSITHNTVDINENISM